jgi:phosphoribosylamine---glycine ligase
MQILLIGSGGREHALAWKLAQSPKIEHVFVAPGNVGTELENKVSNVNITDIPELITFAKQNNIAFTVVGPEAPLAAGIVDHFRNQSLKIWGPTQYCAQLESSKVFSKNFMQKYNIPTAKYATFNDGDSAKDYLRTQSIPIVIKADGLAAGKGVLVAENLLDALNFIDEIFANQKFGSAGSKVVIEEFLDGVEASFIVMIDGNHILPMATSQDHKRLLNNDLGPNTGGMGAYSPAPIVTKEIHDRVIREIIQPVIDGMMDSGHQYTGFLYAGLMIDTHGNPKTLEFNCRFGDPETQPIMMRLESDLCELIEAGINGKLDTVTAKWCDEYAVGVVLASKGYPDNPQKNDIITGCDMLHSLANIKAFYAGTKLENNLLYTDGGRVLCVVGLDKNLALAKQTAYAAIEYIKFDGMQYRTDISDKGL